MQALPKIPYTTILLPVVEELNLSLVEYVTLDVIYKLQVTFKSGWCEYSPEDIAVISLTTRATIYRTITNCIKKGLLEKKGKLLKTTNLWCEKTSVIPSQNETILSQNETVGSKISSQNETKKSQNEIKSLERRAYTISKYYIRKNILSPVLYSTKEKKENVTKKEKKSLEVAKTDWKGFSRRRFKVVDEGVTYVVDDANQVAYDIENITEVAVTVYKQGFKKSVKKIENYEKLITNALLKNHNPNEILIAIENAAADDFYSGRSGKWKGCDLTWILTINTQRDNVAKLFEKVPVQKKLTAREKYEANIDKWLKS